jgi:hypothetical protein
MPRFRFPKKYLTGRFIKFIIILPFGITWELIGRFWEWWHFSPSSTILKFMRTREKILFNFIDGEKISKKTIKEPKK